MFKNFIKKVFKKRSPIYYSMENIENKKPLTALQKAQRNYYLKMKNDPDFIKKRNENLKNRRLNDPEFVEKQKNASLKNYYKIKDDPEYKKKVSLYKKQQWIKKKENNLLL